MQEHSFDQILAAWRHRRENLPLTIDSHCIQSIRLLAEGHPVAAAQIASAGHEPADAVNDWLNRIRAGGAEFDSQGNLVGCVLSLNPTPHRFQVDGQELYAWCALDTLFLPALLGKPARVESTCPTTGTRIQLTITPAGVETFEPPDTVLSVVIPGVTPGCAPDAKGGPQGPTCSRMHFFSSREGASTWLVDQPGVAVFSVDDAWRLAREVWIEPFDGRRSVR